MSLSPFLRTPLTDFAGSLLNQQYMGGMCGDFEMRTMECLEAYGMVRGQEKCADLIHDYIECTSRDKRMKRCLAMYNERQKQIKEGKLKGDEKYEPTPRMGSYNASH